MNTLLLDRTTWDLCVDANGDIATASNPYAIAQDAASAIRLFRGELWYNVAPGVPYFQDVLGRAPPAPFLKARFEAAALTVPETVRARCSLNRLVDRRLTGKVEIVDVNNQTARVGF